MGFFDKLKSGLSKTKSAIVGKIDNLFKIAGNRDLFVKLNISGHTDDVGTEHYNQSLSERRAAAVKEALVNYGASAEQITTHGLGMSQPRRLPTATDTEQTIDYIRGENRRAEIYLDFES